MASKGKYITLMNYCGNLNGVNGVKTGFTNKARQMPCCVMQ